MPESAGVLSSLPWVVTEPSANNAMTYESPSDSATTLETETPVHPQRIPLPSGVIRKLLLCPEPIAAMWVRFAGKSLEYPTKSKPQLAMTVGVKTATELARTPAL